MVDAKGNITSISVDYRKQQTLVTFALSEVPDVFNGLMDVELSIKIAKYHEKRSLDANAYAWVLMSKIAEKLNTTKEDIYELMLKRYGVLYQDEKGFIVITIKSNIDIYTIAGHWLKCKDCGNFTSYIMIKGSSDYNTAEMSHFIDGIVSEAKELGIQTETPEEIERIKALWQRNSGQS